MARGGQNRPLKITSGPDHQAISYSSVNSKTVMSMSSPRDAERRGRMVRRTDDHLSTEISWMDR